MSEFSINEEVILNRVTQIAATHADLDALREALERFEASFRKLVEQDTYAFWVTAAGSSNLLYISPVAVELLQESRQSTDSNPMRFLQHIHPQDRARLSAALSSLSEPLDAEFRIVTSDQSIRWIRARSFPLYDERGRLYRLAGLAHDITRQKEKQLKLEGSRQQYKSLFDHNPDAVYHFDLEGNFLSANSRLQALTGYTIDELMNMSFIPIVEPAYREKTLEHFQKAAAGEPQNYDTVGRRKDGTRFDVNVTNIPITVDGEIVGVYGIAKDITARTETRRALLRQARQQAAVVSLGQRALSGIDLPSLMREAVTQITDILNVEFSQILKFEPRHDSFLLKEGSGWREGLVGTARVPTGMKSQAGYTILANRTPQEDSWQAPDARQSGQPVLMENATTETRFAVCDFMTEHGIVSSLTVVIPGPQRPYGVLGVCSKKQQPFSEDDGQFLQAMANVLGSTIARNTLYEQTQTQARQMQKIIDAVPQGLLLLDAQFNIRLANPVARSYLPVINASSAGDTLSHVGRTPMEVIAGDVRHNGTSVFEIAIPADDPPSSERIFELLASSVTIDAGETGWLLVIREVTDERLIQERIKLQERLASVGQLAAGIAHDFNNILSVIILNTQLVQLTPGLPAKVSGRLQTVFEASQNASHLIAQILDFSRRSVMERKRFDLRPFLEQTAGLLRRTLADNIAIQFTSADGPFLVRADSARLQQVIMNMAFNARDAMPAGGQLTIDLQRTHVTEEQKAAKPNLQPGHWAVLTITDTGLGMTPDVMSRIYEPFFTTKGPKEGTGLGLAQAYGVVKQHGGHVDVSSARGEGTTFKIYLPLVDPLPQSSSGAPHDEEAA